jgi:hypothetical protein
VTCPLCGSPGEQAFTSFACSSPPCKNYVQKPGGAKANMRDYFDAQYRLQHAGIPRHMWAGLSHERMLDLVRKMFGSA